MSSFSLPSRNTASFTNTSRNSSTERTLLRHGTGAQMIAIDENRVLDDPNFILEESLEDTTFDQMDVQPWSNQQRN